MNKFVETIVSSSSYSKVQWQWRMKIQLETAVAMMIEPINEIPNEKLSGETNQLDYPS